MSKILTINTEYEGGGAANIANMIFKSLKKNNDSESEFLCRNADKTLKFVNDFNVNKHEINFNAALTRFLGLDSTFAITWKKNFTLEYIDRFDIIHLHNIHGYFLDINTLKYLKKKKVIWTFHDMWPITGHCSHSLECEKWITGCYKCPHMDIYPKIYLDTSKKMYNLKERIFTEIEDLTIVAPSKWMLEKIKNSYLKEKRIVLINNGVDQSIFYPRASNHLRYKYSIERNKKIVLFVAANINNKLKGLNYLVEAINNLTKKEDIVLVTVGNSTGIESLFNFGIEMIKLGYVNDKNKLAQIYSDSDIFITPSLAENYPCTVQEAMSCGTPSIGFDIGGIPELIIDNFTGKLVKEQDSKMLSEAISILVSDDNLLTELSQNCINFSRNYTLEEMLDKYQKVYYNNFTNK